jgi:hypothetical protein
MKPEVYSALVELCADICRRNGKRKLAWIADRDKAFGYEVKNAEMLLTVHRWFARKSCPGNWLMERLGCLAQEVNSRLGNKGDLRIYKSRQDTCRLKPSSLNQKFPRLDSMI